MKHLVTVAVILASLGAATAKAASERTFYWTTREATARSGYEGCAGGYPRLNTRPRRYKNFMCVKQTYVLGELWYVVTPLIVTGPDTYRLGMASRTSHENYLRLLSKSRAG